MVFEIGSVKMKKMLCYIAVIAAQMARDPDLLQKAMDAWKKLVMTTGFEQIKLEYNRTEEQLAKWAPQFNSQKPPSKEEIDSFYGSKIL